MRLFEGTPFDIPPTCDRCQKLESDCQCPPMEPVKERVPRNKQQVKVYLERRKHGKTITCIKGVHGSDTAEVLKLLKDQFGCGGTVKNELIELQGDHSQESKVALKAIGFKILK